MLNGAFPSGLDQITVLACYDTRASGHQAMELMNRFNHRADLPVRLDVRLWRWDVLAQPEIGEALAADIEDADLLVVVVQAGDEEATDDLLGLVRGWSESHRGTAAALLMFQTGRDSLGPLARTLHQLVQSHGLAVLHGAGAAAPRESCLLDA